MTEVWRDIPGYENKYQASNLGNVRSLDWRNTGQTRNLVLNKHNRDYLQVRLSNGLESKAYMVHRLVALAFLEGYEKGMVVNHINEDKKDNRACNLEWVTQQKNVIYTSEKHPTPKRKAYKRMIPVVQCSTDGTPIRRFSCVKEVKHFGFDPTPVKGCCDGFRKTAYGFKWRYAV